MNLRSDYLSESIHSIMKKFLLGILVIPFAVFSQETEVRVIEQLVPKQSGIFSLGLRSTLSAFNGHEDESVEDGIGGQFRVQFANRINSD